jgi:hypothetical protein
VKDNWNATLTSPDWTQTGSEDSEYNILNENGVVTPFDLYTLAAWPFLTVSWTGQKADSLKLYQKQYAHWNFQCNTMEDGRKASEFHSYMKTLNSIDEAAGFIKLSCQAVILLMVLFALFIPVLSGLKAKGKLKKTPATYLWYVYNIKTFLAWVLTLIALLFTYLMRQKVKSVTVEDTEFFRDNFCISSYVSHQISLFYDFRSEIEFNAMILFSMAGLHMLYVCCTYPVLCCCIGLKSQIRKENEE